MNKRIRKKKTKQILTKIPHGDITDSDRRFLKIHGKDYIKQRYNVSPDFLLVIYDNKDRIVKKVSEFISEVSNAAGRVFYSLGRAFSRIGKGLMNTSERG